MIKMAFVLMVLALGTSNVCAMPLAPRASTAYPNAVVEVKIICQEDGFCYQKGRRPVARWVYGEKNFSGPYVGPGSYGWPNWRSRWWLF